MNNLLRHTIHKLTLLHLILLCLSLPNTLISAPSKKKKKQKHTKTTNILLPILAFSLPLLAVAYYHKNTTKPTEPSPPSYINITNTNTQQTSPQKTTPRDTIIQKILDDFIQDFQIDQAIQNAHTSSQTPITYLAQHLKKPELIHAYAKLTSNLEQLNTITNEDIELLYYYLNRKQDKAYENYLKEKQQLQNNTYKDTKDYLKEQPYLQFKEYVKYRKYLEQASKKYSFIDYTKYLQQLTYKKYKKYLGPLAKKQRGYNLFHSYTIYQQQYAQEPELNYKHYLKDKQANKHKQYKQHLAQAIYLVAQKLLYSNKAKSLLKKTYANNNTLLHLLVYNAKKHNPFYTYHIQQLINLGADPNAKNSNNQSPIDLCQKTGTYTETSTTTANTLHRIKYTKYNQHNKVVETITCDARGIKIEASQITYGPDNKKTLLTKIKYNRDNTPVEITQDSYNTYGIRTKTTNCDPQTTTIQPTQHIKKATCTQTYKTKQFNMQGFILAITKINNQAYNRQYNKEGNSKVVLNKNWKVSWKKHTSISPQYKEKQPQEVHQQSLNTITKI